MGSSKPESVSAPTVTPSSAKSSFARIPNFSNALSGLGSTTTKLVLVPGTGKGTKKKARYTQVTETSLDPGLQSSLANIQSGLDQALSFINRDPSQALADLDAGKNSFYNLNREINTRRANDAIGSAQLRYSRSGLENSTSRGAFEGQIARDANLQDLATRSDAINQVNQMALNNIASQGGLLQGLAGIMMPLNQASDTKWLAGRSSFDSMSQLNAQLAQQASLANQQAQLDAMKFNAQMQMQAAQQRQAMMGNLIGAGVSLGGAALLGPLGSGANFAKSLGSLGGGAASAPSGLLDAGTFGSALSSASGGFGPQSLGVFI